MRGQAAQENFRGMGVCTHSSGTMYQGGCVVCFDWLWRTNALTNINSICIFCEAWSENNLWQLWWRLEKQFFFYFFIKPNVVKNPIWLLDCFLLYLSMIWYDLTIQDITIAWNHIISCKITNSCSFLHLHHPKLFMNHLLLRLWAA